MLTKNQTFWSVSFSYGMQQQSTISGLDCDVRWKVDFIWEPVTTGSVLWLKRSSKALPKAKLAPKKGHGHCLVVCCLSDPLQLFESQWNHYIWEVCSANWWDVLKPAMIVSSIGQQKGPSPSPWQQRTTCHTNNASKVPKKKKVEWIGLRSFASSSVFTWPLTNWWPLLQASWQLFARETLPQLAGGKNVFKSSSNPEAWIFMLQE